MEQKAHAIFPMRAGSKRVPDKNIRMMNGRPLYEWAIDMALTCEKIDKIILTTDIQEVLDKYKNHDRIITLERPENLRDNCDINWVMDDVLNRVDGEHFIQLQVTSPLLTKETTDNSIETYFDNLENHNTLFSVYPMQLRVFDKDKKPVNHKLEDAPTTQDLDLWYVEDNAIYIFSRSSFNKNNKRVIGQQDLPYLLPISKIDSADIDDEEDFELAELLLKGKSVS
jgi:CMP-N-acetylneuraminic acid synthetase